MNIKEFAEKFIKAEDEAWLNGNFDALEKMEDSKVVYYMPPPMPDVVGFEAHKQYILGNRQLSSGLRQEWHYLTGEGNLFALSYKATGQFTGQVPGLPPTVGKNFINNFLFLLRLNKGKVVEVWANGNMTIK